MSKDLFEQIREKEYYDVFGIDMQDGNLLEYLLRTSAIPAHIEEEIWDRLNANVISQEECDNIIEYLKANQRDPIRDGFSYNATDIKYKLNKLKKE